MNTLVFGFYGEGKRDQGYLQRIVERMIERLIPHVEVLSMPYETSKADQKSKIIDIATQAAGIHFVVIHLDADAPDTTRAFEERFLPGYKALEAANQNVNRQLVPIIPVRMTEAWMLTDFEAFRQVTRTKLTASELNFPATPEHVERLNAKQVFEEAVRQCQPGRKKAALSSADVYRPLASLTRLQQLERVPAYQEFKGRLAETLVSLNYLESTHG